MKEMVSKVTTTTTTTITVPYNRQKEMVSQGRLSQRETTGRTTPAISLEGVPGEYDFRKFLTPAFEGFRPVQNTSGGSSYNSIAVTTNKESWKNIPVSFINGLFGPVRKPDDKSRWYTNLSGVVEGGDVPAITTYDDNYPPSKPIATVQTTGQDLSARLTQATPTGNTRAKLKFTFITSGI